MTSLAKRFAESAHAGRDEDGAPEIAHVRRVATSVLPEARNVAWLHDVLERSSLSAADLMSAGFTPDEVEAVQLLTRDRSTDNDDAYLAHVAVIGMATGRAGRLARQVKTADLLDRLWHPRVHPNGWTPPYAEALHLLESGRVPIR